MASVVVAGVERSDKKPLNPVSVTGLYLLAPGAKELFGAAADAEVDMELK